MTQSPELVIKRTQVVVGAPTPPPEPEKVKMPDTEAELEERRSNVLAAMWGPTKPQPTAPPAEPDPEPAPEPAGDAPPAAPAADDAPAPAAPAAPAAAEPAAVDTDALIAKTAAKIGEEVGRAMDRSPAAPSAPEPDPAPELTPEDTRDAEIIAKMEELDPSLKGRAEAFKAFAHRRYDYEAAWREKHPGAQFSPDDAEHEEFYKGQPEIDPEVFQEAKDELRVDRKVAQRLKPIEEKADAEARRTKSDRAFADAAPKITASVSGKIMEVVGHVSSEVAGLLKDMNPLALKPEEIAKLEEADPIVARVLGPMVNQQLVPMLVELEKSVAPGAEYALDPRTNPVHADIARYLVKFEESKPGRRDGREFVTLADMNQRTVEIINGKGTDESKQRRIEDLQARHWTATVDDIQKTIVDDISARAKAAVDDLDGIARRKYKGEPKAPAARTAAPQPTPEPQTVPANNGKPRPPSVASQATVVDTSRSGKQNEKSFGEIAVATHWGA